MYRGPRARPWCAPRGPWAVLVLVLALALGCAERDERTSPLAAYCKARVLGIGEVEVETDYIPHVINCENGSASFEALKAQAVAARSYLYYRMDRAGEIVDGTGDQVYSCGRSPSMLAYQAADATSGQVLMYRDTPVAAFYVAGAKQSAPECKGGAVDPTSTETYVTYNSGRRGGDVQQTALGWVHPENHANRGCKSQNGAACLSDAGWRHDEILRFYYGEDIELVQAHGSCVTEARPGPLGARSGGCSAGTGIGLVHGLGLGLLGLLALLGTARRPTRKKARKKARRKTRNKTRRPR